MVPRHELLTQCTVFLPSLKHVQTAGPWPWQGAGKQLNVDAQGRECKISELFGEGSCLTAPKQCFSQLKPQKPQNTCYIAGIHVTFNS